MTGKEVHQDHLDVDEASDDAVVCRNLDVRNGFGGQTHVNLFDPGDERDAEMHSGRSNCVKEGPVPEVDADEAFPDDVNGADEDSDGDADDDDGKTNPDAQAFNPFEIAFFKL